MSLHATILPLACATALVIALGGAASAAPPDSVDNQADVNHPDIHDKVGKGDGTNANPNGANANGGNIHGIANTPGQNGDNPNNDGTNGFANELETVHGGIGDVNKNAE